MTDNWDGARYDDDPFDWATLDPGVTRFVNVETPSHATARLEAEMNNPGFHAVKIRRIYGPGLWFRVQLMRFRKGGDRG